MGAVALVAAGAFALAVQRGSEARAEKENAIRQGELARGHEYAANILAASALQEKPDRKQAAVIALQSCPTDLRGWEWHHLNLKLDQTKGGIKGLNPVAFADYSSDGRYLLTAERGRTYKLWDAAELFNSNPESAAWKLLDASSGEVRPVWSLTLEPGVTEPVESNGRQAAKVSFSPDGNRVVIGTSEGVIVWDVATGSDRKMPGPMPMALWVDGDRILGTARTEDVSQVWDLHSQQENLSASAKSARPKPLCFQYRRRITRDQPRYGGGNQ